MSKKKYGHNTMKVIRLGLQDRVFNEMKKPGFSASGLSRELESEGINISAQSIRKFIRKSKKAQQKVIQKDLRAAEIHRKTLMDYDKTLRDILDEVKDVKSEARTEKDFTTYNQMVDKLYKGIELFAKLTGDIKPKGSIDINIIYNEINDNVEKEMKNLKSEMFKENIIDVDAEILREDEEATQKIRT